MPPHTGGCWLRTTGCRYNQKGGRILVISGRDGSSTVVVTGPMFGYNGASLLPIAARRRGRRCDDGSPSIDLKHARQTALTPGPTKGKIAQRRRRLQPRRRLGWILGRHRPGEPFCSRRSDRQPPARIDRTGLHPDNPTGMRNFTSSRL